MLQMRRNMQRDDEIRGHDMLDIGDSTPSRSRALSRGRAREPINLGSRLRATI